MDTDYLLDMETTAFTHAKKVKFSDVVRVYSDPIDKSIPVENILGPMNSNRDVKSILLPPKYKSFSDQHNALSCTIVIILLLFLSVVFITLGILLQHILIVEIDKGTIANNQTNTFPDVEYQ